MSAIRWLVDEDAQHRGLIAALRARGVDVVTAFDAGLTGSDDNAILSYSTKEGRAVYTFNAGDFCRLHSEYLQQQLPHAGIVVVPRQRYDLREQLWRLFQLINTRTAEDMQSRLEFL